MGKPAARIGDMHVCPMVTGVVPHVGGPVMGPGVPTVLIGGMPAAVMGDMCTCTGPPDTIILGSSGVLIGGKPAARMGDQCVHGGMIVIGCPTVLIGEVAGGGGGGAVSAMPVSVLVDKVVMQKVPGSTQSYTLKKASKGKKPFCEKCEKAKQEQAKAKQIKPKPAENTSTKIEEPEEEKDVVVSFGSGAKQAFISNLTINILKEIGRLSKNYNIKITSTSRTVQDQARIMFNNCRKNGVAEQMKIYKTPGQKVIKVYETYTEAKASDDEIKGAMEDKINEVGPENVSKHIADPSKLNTFDIAQSSLKDKLKFKSEANKHAHVEKLLDENGCFHLQIPQ